MDLSSFTEIIKAEARTEQSIAKHQAAIMELEQESSNRINFLGAVIIEGMTYEEYVDRFHKLAQRTLQLVKVGVPMWAHEIGQHAGWKDQVKVPGTDHTLLVQVELFAETQLDAVTPDTWQSVDASWRIPNAFINRRYAVQHPLPATEGQMADYFVENSVQLSMRLSQVEGIVGILEDAHKAGVESQAYADHQRYSKSSGSIS